MTLPRFLDCAYALLIEEMQRAGHDLGVAVEKMQEWAAETPKRTTENLSARNTESMKVFQSMMFGMKNT